MVHLLTVGGPFEAKVLAARLGSEGIVVSLRGAVDGPYPFGDVLVDVDAEGYELARQLVLADEVEAAFDEPVAGASPRPLMMRPWVAVPAVVCVAVASAVARILAVAV